MKTEAVQPDKGGYWQVVEKRIDFWRERSLPPAFFIVFQKTPSYRKSEQHTDR